MSTEQPNVIRVLRLDVWGNEDDGFEWNDWWEVGTADLSVADLPEAELLAWFHEQGYIGTTDTALVTVEDDDYNLLICDATDGNRPKYALAYGEVL